MHFFQDHSDLDGLPEPDLVGKQGLPVHLEQRSVGGVNLVFEQFDLLFIDARERPEFRIRLARTQSARNDSETVKREVRRSRRVSV